MINAKALGLGLTRLPEGLRVSKDGPLACWMLSLLILNVLFALLPLMSKATISIVLPVLGI